MNEPMPLRVTAREPMADDVVGLELARADGTELPAWAPGAHIDLHLPAGRETMIRQYSLCGDPRDRSRYRIAVLLAPSGRGGSRHIHDRLTEGDTVLTSPPRNTFELVPAEHYVFVAGGIGITPILSMVHRVASSGTSWELHYTGRTRRSMAFTSQLPGAGGSVTLAPRDETGRLDVTHLLGMARTDTAVYCCGPESLLEAAEKATAHWPAGALHVERFVNSQTVHEPGDEPFDVELVLSGKTVTVEPGVSILTAAASAGVRVFSSCREGTCGTCETFVVDGQVDHRDAVLTDEEKEESEVMMICVSRSRGGTLRLEL
ncbi:PDR/VanB family oxidoreductase [Saccharomonospora sp. NPDC046836]|uniref:PDR/VanB family oxidoreductase n=1 Tax=Saccharomonospora sp. NPDC046836 TaxID=3156921 RepID=UPI0033C68585